MSSKIFCSSICVRMLHVNISPKRWDRRHLISFSLLRNEISYAFTGNSTITKCLIAMLRDWKEASNFHGIWNQCSEFQYNLRKIIPAFISLARCSAFHLHPSQGSVEAIHLFYSELLRRRFKINFRLQKNSLVDKETTPYCLADNCNISRLSSPVFPTFTEVNSFGQRVKKKWYKS